MNNNKTTTILLGAILAIGLGVLIVSLQLEVKPQVTVEAPQANLGYSGYNELGASGMTQTTVNVGIESGTTASTTAYKILSEKYGRMWADIQVDIGAANEVRLYFGTTTYSDGSTTTYASSTDYWAIGKSLSSSTARVYEITPDNLWFGEVWGIATTATVTVRTMEK